jgi:flagellar L-ring protein precursor FlgH
MKKLISIILLVILSVNLNAASLWKKKNRSVFADRKAISRGDIVTILIEETSMAQTSKSTESDKELTIGGEAGTNSDGEETIFNSVAKMIPLFGATAKGNSEFDHETEDARQTALMAKIAVVVDDIDENGNLILKGERMIKINSDEQKMVLTGVCRVDDVAADNTVSSTKIAKAKITFDGEVNFSDKKRKGFISKTANAVWNFLF